MFKNVVQTVGNGARAGETTSRGVFVNDYVHRLQGTNGSGWEHWRILFKCATKDI